MLRPCKRCKSNLDLHIIKSPRIWSSYGGRWLITCACGNCGSQAKTPGAAGRKWNRIQQGYNVDGY